MKIGNGGVSEKAKAQRSWRIWRNGWRSNTDNGNRRQRLFNAPKRKSSNGESIGNVGGDGGIVARHRKLANAASAATVAAAKIEKLAAAR